MCKYLISLLYIMLLSTSTLAAPKPLNHGLTYQAGTDLQLYLASEKYDGVRAYWDGKQLWSRSGKAIVAPKWFTEKFPAIALDGELWAGRGNFSQVVSTVRKKKPVDEQWQKISYMLFELPYAPDDFAKRYQRLQKYAQSSPQLYAIEQRQLQDANDLEKMLDHIIKNGGEGVMLHRSASLYTPGRSADILKVKRHQDAEAVVLDILPGKGKYSGKMGALLVRTADDRTFKIGSGFSDKERENPPAIGATITYKYFGYTSSGLPRFASFLRIRPQDL